MVTFTKPLYSGLQLAAKQKSLYGQYYARHLLNGLNAAFEEFRVSSNDRAIIGEAILRWRILKDAGIPQPGDAATKSLYKFDDFLVRWLHTQSKNKCEVCTK